jgi:hypothetical protein
MFKKIFSFKNKQEKIGIILGSTCFFPPFIISMLVGVVTNIVIGLIIMLITQCLWLTSIELCMVSLEIENKELKEKLKNM